MKELDLFEKIISQYGNEVLQNTRLIIALSFLILTNIILGIINLIAQVKLKNKEKQIYSYSIRENKRLNVLEQIYYSLEELSYFNENESQTLLSKLKEIEAFVSKNKIYLSRDFINCISGICDYYKGILVDYRKKKYETEIELMNVYVKLFNK